MISGIVVCEESDLKKELINYFYAISHVGAKIISNQSDIENQKMINSARFIVFAQKEIDDFSIIKKLHRDYPHLYLYYYYPFLSIDNGQFGDYSYFNQIIVGDHRTKNLTRIFNKIYQNYWKKIPYENIGISYENISPRLKRVISYIETHDIKNCSTAKLSEYLNISQGYFSQEFKKETGQTFREFMQKLLAYYESIIFDQMELTAKQASTLLGYSELSSFSRSFKKRKGYSPSKRRNNKLKIIA
jgi:YesN/AraC family two-component response regulator